MIPKETQKILLKIKSRSEKNALRLFHEAATRVPAYKDFLSKNNIQHKKIKSIQDFEAVPAVNKKNYLRKYDLDDLSWDGNRFDTTLISVSSGSSGNPFFWPRGDSQFGDAADIYKKIYTDVYGADKKSTLLIVCFSMGLWVAGSYTLMGAVAAKEELGLKMHIVTPGIDREDIILSAKNLIDQYEQVILAGYPPLLKDALDGGAKAGINWSKYNVKFMFAGEQVGELWRDYVLGLAGNKDATESMNIYGTADAGVLAHETPLSILVRRAYEKDLDAQILKFGSAISPTLAQYDPLTRYFEESSGELLFTASAGLPLIRYNIQDNGGLYAMEELVQPVKQELHKSKNIPDLIKTWPRPFVYVHGRKDFTVSLYGLMIFPENLKLGLQSKEIVQDVSGKFTMKSDTMSDMNQKFRLNIELAEGVGANQALKKKIGTVLVKRLREVNTEYRRLYKAMGKKAEPELTLHEYGKSKLFKAGNKQKWVE